MKNLHKASFFLLLKTKNNVLGVSIKLMRFNTNLFPQIISPLILHHRLPDGFRQLVGTRGGLEATTDTLQSLDYLLGIHAFHETPHTLGVAAAASIKLNIMNDSVSDFELNHLTASALGIVGVFHSNNANG